MLRTGWLLLLALVTFSLFAGSPATAQWSSDPALNFAIADRTSEQVLPKIAPTADGGLYVGWFDLASGNYDVYLQRLDRDGMEQWPHNGILVSANVQNTSLVDWDLIADSSDNAVLVFTDIRTGGDLDVYAYRVTPAGQMLWGANGVALSMNDDFEPAPRVAEAGDGDFVFIWSRLPDAAEAAIMMQRLAPDGTPRLAAGGIPVVAQSGEDPAFCAIVPAEDGNVIVSWVRDITVFQSPRHVRARKFDPDGVPLWPVVMVFDAISVPIAYTPQLKADGMGGAIVLWHRSSGNLYNSLVQRLDATGTELFPHNGITVSLEGTRHHLDPAMALDPPSGNLVVVWNERNANQSQWGIYAQKLSVAGARLWGNDGIELLPVNTIWKSPPRCAPLDGGAVVFLSDEPTGQFARDRVLGMRLDANGAQVWPSSPLVVSSVLSSKSRLPVVIDGDGRALMVWEDDRSGTVDIYGQNVNPDGTLGPASTGVEDPLAAPPGRLVLAQNEPNPFAGTTTIAVARGDGRHQGGIEIFDAVGRVVRRLELPAGARAVVWNGRGEDGEGLPSGTYFYRLVGDEPGTATRKAVLLH